MDAMGGANAMGRPPIPPPDLPTLSGMSPEGGGQATPDRVGGVVRLFHEIEKTIDMVAEAVPAISPRLDKVKTDLRDILTTISVTAGAGGGEASEGEMESSVPSSPFGSSY